MDCRISENRGISRTNRKAAWFLYGLAGLRAVAGVAAGPTGGSDLVSMNGTAVHDSDTSALSGVVHASRTIPTWENPSKSTDGSQPTSSIRM